MSNIWLRITYKMEKMKGSVVEQPTEIKRHRLDIQIHSIWFRFKFEKENGKPGHHYGPSLLRNHFLNCFNTFLSF